MGQSTATKPSRSDEVLDADQQLRIANQVRDHFDSMAPKRPSKPNRSESDPTPTSPLCQQNVSVPEFDKLQSLRSQSLCLFSGSNCVDQDEFVETQYYKELASIDKQHHTTGSGFIKVEKERCEDAYDLELEGGCGNGVQRQTVFRTNPATNDWIPSVEANQVVHVSLKPNRSENC